MSSLTSYLAKKGVVDPSRLQRALLNQAINGGSTGLNLLELEAVDEATLVEMTGKFHHLGTASSSEVVDADPDVVHAVATGRCEELELVAIRREDDRIVVACYEPPTSTERLLLEKEVGSKLRFVVASPLAIAIVLAAHHELPLGSRVARIIRRVGVEDFGLAALGEREARVRELVESREGDGSTGLETPAEVEDEDDWDWDDEEDEQEEEEEEELRERESVVGKYIIINRIGARPRRPSIQTRAVARPRAPTPGPERARPVEASLEADVTFTDGSRRASPDTRPHRVTAPPASPRSEPPPRKKRDSVPPAVLTEVIDDYLSDAPSRPSRPSRRPPSSPPREEEKAADEVTVMRTVSVTAADQVSEPLVPDDPPTLTEGSPPEGKEKVERQTMSGAAASIHRIKEARGGSVQGYAVEVPELMSLTEVLELIETSDRASEITDAVQRYALQFFDFVLVLRYRKGRFEVTAVSSRGWTWPVDQLPVKLMGYDQLPETIRKLGQPYLGQLDETGRMAEILEACGRPRPVNAIMFPIAIKGRAVVVIYGDNGTNPSSFDEVNDLFHATWVATNRIVALLEESRR